MLRAVLLLLCAAFADAGGGGHDAMFGCRGKACPVTELTDANWASEIGAAPHFVMFYAPWCGHCKTLAPKMKKAALALADTGLKVGACDVEPNPKVQALFSDIRGFPTCKFVTSASGKGSLNYDGPREADDIARWVKDDAAKKMKVELIEPVAVKKFDELYTFFGRAALDNKPVLFAIGSETAAPDWLNKLHGKLTEDLLKEAKADDPEAPAKALLKEARAATKNSAAKEAIDEAMKALEQSGSKAKPLFSAAYASDGETAAAFNATLKPGDVHVFVAALDRKALGLSVVAAFGANPVVAQKRGKVDLAALKAFVESVAAAAKAGPAQLKGVSDVATLPELPKPNSVLAAEARAAKKKASAGEVSPVASAADLASKCYDLSSAKTCAVILTDGPVSAGDFSDVAAKYAANGFAFVHVDAATAPAALFAALRGPNEALPALVVVKGGKRARAARAHGADAFAAMLEAVIGGEGKFDKFAGGLPAWPAAAAEGAAAGADGDEYDL